MRDTVQMGEKTGKIYSPNKENYPLRPPTYGGFLTVITNY